MDKKSIWHQNVSTNARAKTIILIVLSIIFIGLAILVWANQTGRISLWASGTINLETCNTSSTDPNTCIDVFSVIVSRDCNLNRATLSWYTGSTSTNYNWYTVQRKEDGGQFISLVNQQAYVPDKNGYGKYIDNNLDQNKKYIYRVYVKRTNEGPSPTRDKTLRSGESSIPLCSTVLSCQNECSSGQAGCLIQNNITSPWNCLQDSNGCWRKVASNPCPNDTNCYNGTCINVNTPSSTLSPTSDHSPTLYPTTTPNKLNTPGVTATLVDDNTINIKPVYRGSVINSYKIYNADNNQMITQVTSLAEASGETISGLQCETTYQYYVKASGDVYDQNKDIFIINNKTIDSDSSETISITTTSCSTPDPSDDIENQTVTGVTAQAGESTITLTWNAIDGATGYHIYDCSDNLITATSQTSFKFTGLPCDTEFCYYIRAHDDSGKQSKISDKLSIKTGVCTITSNDPDSSTDSDNPINSQITSVTKLISTGSSLWFNILLAIIITFGIGYVMFRRKSYNSD